MSSDYESKTICKSIYIEKGFSGIVMVLRMFPERLHEEILEELSANMYEWESKLLPDEKRDLNLNISSHATSIFSEDEEYFRDLNDTLRLLLFEENRIDENMKKELSRIEEFPSILEGTDIDCISLMNEESETLRLRIENVRTHIDHFDLKYKKKIERTLDGLF